MHRAIDRARGSLPTTPASTSLSAERMTRGAGGELAFLADDGTPVEMGLVLGWLDGNAEIEVLALGNVRRRWDRSWCRRLCELG